ncbi:MAG: hypothetical protein IT518_09310 [Burkholderiales bacterium]|nr:hypothetical protein [Burkholderiales bacterium]
MMRVVTALLAFAAFAAFADELPEGLRTDRDLRGAYRAALCDRADVTADLCARTLRSYAGETPAPTPRPADPSRYRLLFIPGFLAACFDSIRSFEDVIEVARKQGYAAQLLDVGGRDGVRENARRIGQQIGKLPDDGRRLVLIGHSKGAVEALQMLVDHPELGARVAGVLSVAGALQGSPLADDVAPIAPALGLLPVGHCRRGEGAPIRDLTTGERARWWQEEAPKLTRPLYSLVALPDLDLLSALVVLPSASLSRHSRDNDGMLLARNQVAAGGYLLGVVNADHLTVGIPYPGDAWVFAFRKVDFARTQVILAAIDVIAARD